MNLIQHLDYLFNPRSAAVIGASNIPGKGVKTALIISGGFAETGAEGSKAERKVLEIARRGGIRFIGPNCAGHFNTFAGLFTAPSLPPVKEGPVSFVAPSGNLGLGVLAMGYEMGLGLRKYF